MPRGVENAQGVVSWVILTRGVHFWLQNKAIPKLFNSFTVTQTAPFKFLFSCARLCRLIRVSGRTMLRVPRNGRVVQPIAGLLAPFHRLRGQGRTWVGFQRYPPPRAAFLGALAFELALCDPGSEKR